MTGRNGGDSTRWPPAAANQRAVWPIARRHQNADKHAGMQLDPDIESSLKVIEVPSTLADAKEPESLIMREVGECGYSEDATFAIKLALEEAMINAVKHGNGNDDSKRITVGYCVRPDQVVILVRDQGTGFVPADVPDPTHPDRLPLPNGRGIMLMRAYMSGLHYRAGGTEVCLIKRNE